MIHVWASTERPKVVFAVGTAAGVCVCVCVCVCVFVTTLFVQIGEADKGKAMKLPALHTSLSL